MKKLFITMLTCSFILTATAQNTPPASTPFPKTISVSGSAEMEIIPDEIFVNITLREYQKRGEAKKDIEILKTAFLESCKAASIPDSVISIQSFTGYSNYLSYKKRKKDPDLFSSITYQIKFKDSKTLDALVEKLDDEATQNFVIASTSHSKMTEFRKQLKIKAVQAAKDKGVYLTEAIGERLGEAVTVTEPDENPGFYLARNEISNNSYSQFNAVYRDGAANEIERKTDVDFKKIKLRYEVSVVFALK